MLLTVSPRGEEGHMSNKMRVCMQFGGAQLLASELLTLSVFAVCGTANLLIQY